MSGHARAAAGAGDAQRVGAQRVDALAASCSPARRTYGGSCGRVIRQEPNTSVDARPRASSRRIVLAGNADPGSGHTSSPSRRTSYG